MMKSSIQLSPNKHLENISKMFEKLYNEEQLTDVTLWCKEGTIKAHRIVLATCSPYFHNIFLDHGRDNLVLVMHGVAYQPLHDLVELIYKGNVEVAVENLNGIYELADELQMAGISGVLHENLESGSKFDNSNHGRDTRFKGLKRVAVDYAEDEVENSAKKKAVEEEQIAEEPAVMKIETEEPVVEGAKTESPKLSAWAKKQRKFKCDLCPSSFKRSSHLTRHQLVHTGERPYACDQCDKAFSRHDKLKHHIRKAHENNDGDYETTLNTTISSPSPPPFIISLVCSEVENDSNTPAKRGRGRPRKYPVAPKPLIKRGRGRPRLNPVNQGINGENYDITNLPYGDLEYLTMPILPRQEEDSVIIEPLVEINTDKDEHEQEKTVPESITEIRHESILTKITKIGECTISVANP